MVTSKQGIKVLQVLAAFQDVNLVGVFKVWLLHTKGADSVADPLPDLYKFVLGVIQNKLAHRYKAPIDLVGKYEISIVPLLDPLSNTPLNECVYKVKAYKNELEELVKGTDTEGVTLWFLAELNKLVNSKG